MDRPAFPLQALLERLVADGAEKVTIPPCPECGRALKLGRRITERDGTRAADVWLWCSACPAASAAFGISPIPHWLTSSAPSQPAASWAEAGGG